jgi:hypothetical protein
LQRRIFFVEEAECAVGFGLALGCLRRAFAFEPLDVGQVAQRGEPERLEELPRRHIGEGGAGLRGADRAVNEPVALEGGDDVAADFAARQFRNLPPRDRCK